MLELLLSQKLNPEYQEAGFSLGQNKDFLYLYRDGVPVASWLATEVRFIDVKAYIQSLLNGFTKTENELKAELVITDNAAEKMTIKWDGERFALVKQNKGLFPDIPLTNVIIMNPKECLKVARFIGECVKDE